jgi:hypothetical protein
MLNRIRSFRRSSSLSLAAGGFAGLVTVLALLVASAGCHSKAQPGEAAFADPSYAKLDTDLRRLAKEMVAAGKEDSVVSILVKVKSGPSCQPELEKAGMQIESTMGEVVTGKAMVKALPQVAMIPAVVQIQGASTYRAGETEQP